jgi:hypothetical protein
VAGEVFELEMLGGAFEKRYRRMRPEVEAMPWGTLDASGYEEHVVVAARRAWTGAAFQEHRTAVACAMALRGMTEVRAPLDLIALASRFPLDEVVHVELCARMAMELGGGTEIIHDPDELIADADPSLPPLLRASELMTRFFCVGEAISIPLLRATWHVARHPLPRAILGRIVKDEAAHGAFGFAFLDWALDRLGEEDRAHLGRQADRAIDALARNWAELRSRPKTGSLEDHPLAWMQTDAYLALASRSLEQAVRRPLLERGIPLVARTYTGERDQSASS